jgi:hypothetical protein
MAVTGTDLLMVERGGVLHKATAAEVAALGGGGATSVVATRIRRSTNQSIPSGTAWTDIAWDTADYQQGGTYWTSGATVTITEDGYYEIGAEITFDGAGFLIDVTAEARITANGNEVASDIQTVPAGALDSLHPATQRFFAAGTVIKAQARHSMGTAVNVITQGDHAPDLFFAKLGGAKGDTGSGGLAGQVSLPVPNNSISAEATLTARGVTPTNVVMIGLAPHSDSDENATDLIDLLSVSATPGTDEITVIASFATPHAGSIRLNWSAL